MESLQFTHRLNELTTFTVPAPSVTLREAAPRIQHPCLDEKVNISMIGRMKNGNHGPMVTCSARLSKNCQQEMNYGSHLCTTTQSSGDYVY